MKIDHFSNEDLIDRARLNEEEGDGSSCSALPNINPAGAFVESQEGGTKKGHLHGTSAFLPNSVSSNISGLLRFYANANIELLGKLRVRKSQ